MEPGATLQAIRTRPVLGAAGLVVVAHGFLLLPLVHGAFHDHDHHHHDGNDGHHHDVAGSHHHDHGGDADRGHEQPPGDPGDPGDHGDHAPEHLGLALTAVAVLVVHEPAVWVEPAAPLPPRLRPPARPARTPRQPRAPPA